MAEHFAFTQEDLPDTEHPTQHKTIMIHQKKISIY